MQISFTNFKGKNLLLVLLAFSLAFMSCEGPAGPEGPQGSQGSEGPQGPVGPSGEDGSQIFSGNGAPDAGTGSIGDYYLDRDTGELYGPKDDSGWGSPAIVLMGEDGQDGADGADGEDGSQIYSGNGPPDSSLGEVGDYYLDKTNYDLYGPKFTILNTNSAMWGFPINLKGADGADGNANVTRYLYPGHDFDGEEIWEGARRSLIMPSEADMRESIWLLYGLGNSSDDIYPIPGSGGWENNFYDFKLSWQSDISAVQFHIFKVQGNGRSFNRFEIIQIETSSTIDFTGNKGSLFPDHLDISDYNQVAEYFGFGD